LEIGWINNIVEIGWDAEDKRKDGKGISLGETDEVKIFIDVVFLCAWKVIV